MAREIRLTSFWFTMSVAAFSVTKKKASCRARKWWVPPDCRGRMIAGPVRVFPNRVHAHRASGLQSPGGFACHGRCRFKPCLAQDERIVRGARTQIRNAERRSLERSQFVVDCDAGTKKPGDGQDRDPKETSAGDQKRFEKKRSPIGQRRCGCGGVCVEWMRKGSGHMEVRFGCGLIMWFIATIIISSFHASRYARLARIRRPRTPDPVTLRAPTGASPFRLRSRCSRWNR